MPKTPLKSARRRASWTAWTSLRLAHPAHEAEQNQKKRTYVVLPKPDNLIRYRQTIRSLLPSGRRGRGAPDEGLAPDGTMRMRRRILAADLIRRPPHPRPFSQQEKGGRAA